jgi:hypothetical protein
MQDTTIHLGDIWALYDNGDPYIVIPTNTTVKSSSGRAVMGRGIAKQAAERFPRLPELYGRALKSGKTINGFYVFPKMRIITIAVKYQWRDDADIGLIESQLKLLKESSKNMKYGAVLCPMLGCGFGRLSYEQILPLLLQYSFKGMSIIVANNDVYANTEYRDSFLPSINGKKDKRVSLSNSFSDIDV